MLLFRVGIFIDFMSYICNSNKESQKPQAVQFDMNHVGTIFNFLDFQMGKIIHCFEIAGRYFQVGMIIKFFKFAGSYDYLVF